MIFIIIIVQQRVKAVKKCKNFKYYKAPFSQLKKKRDLKNPSQKITLLTHAAKFKIEWFSKYKSRKNKICTAFFIDI